MTSKKKSPKLNVEKADVETIELSSEQKALYDVIENTDDNIYITGKAGTGKSVLLEYLVKYTRKTVAVTAPTGIAALNVNGMTVHSFFRFAPDIIDPENLDIDYKTKDILSQMDAIIIDEVSMMRVDLMEGINRKLQLAKKNELPFGGIQMILFGDLYQLPPVITDGELQNYLHQTYGGIYFFNAPVFQKKALKIYELNNIFRQKDPEFRAMLNAIRFGDSSDEVLDKINERTNIRLPEDGYITLAGTNSAVSHINQKKLDELDGEEFTYIADIEGDIKESSFPTEKYLKLKVGAQVMMLKNDTERPRRWANGTLGTITSLDKEVVKVLINGKELSLTRANWEKIRYDYDHEVKALTKQIVSVFNQIPMRLAWAITVHKSQGQTYESAVIDMTGGAFAHGQTYVALSRCKSLEGLYLKSRIRPEDIIIDQEIINFMKQAEIIEEI